MLCLEFTVGRSGVDLSWTVAAISNVRFSCSGVSFCWRADRCFMAARSRVAFWPCWAEADCVQQLMKETTAWDSLLHASVLEISTV